MPSKFNTRTVDALNAVYFLVHYEKQIFVNVQVFNAKNKFVLALLIRRAH